MSPSVFFACSLLICAVLVGDFGADACIGPPGVIINTHHGKGHASDVLDDFLSFFRSKRSLSGAEESDVADFSGVVKSERFAAAMRHVEVPSFVWTSDPRLEINNLTIKDYDTAAAYIKRMPNKILRLTFLNFKIRLTGDVSFALRGRETAQVKGATQKIVFESVVLQMSLDETMKFKRETCDVAVGDVQSKLETLSQNLNLMGVFFNSESLSEISKKEAFVVEKAGRMICYLMDKLIPDFVPDYYNDVMTTW